MWDRRIEAGLAQHSSHIGASNMVCCSCRAALCARPVYGPRVLGRVRSGNLTPSAGKGRPQPPQGRPQRVGANPVLYFSRWSARFRLAEASDYSGLIGAPNAVPERGMKARQSGLIDGGMSGAAARRVAAVTAKALRLPARAEGNAMTGRTPGRSARPSSPASQGRHPDRARTEISSRSPFGIARRPVACGAKPEGCRPMPCRGWP